MISGDLLASGQIIPLAATLIGFLLIFLLSMGGLTVAFVKALRSGGSTRKVRQLEAQEARAFQDLQRGFNRMEERIESLETLFMGRAQHRTFDRERELD